MKILMLAVFLFSSPVWASSSGDSPKYINLVRNYSLSPLGNGSFGISLFFEEAAPGRVSDKVDAFGCSLVMRSTGNFVFTGRYRVDLEEEAGPAGAGADGEGGADSVDSADGADSAGGLWRKQYTNWGRGSDMRVTCRSDQRISDEYVSKVMAGFVRVER